MKHLPSGLAWLLVVFWGAVVVLAAGQAAPGATGLTVVSAGPTGEVAERANANEVRVVFSEPMVELGRIPSPVTAAFFKISPALTGTFRWSGTTILVFTPDPKRPLAYATKYDVTIDTTAQAASGRRLSKPYAFSFTTPTTRLIEPRWYRKAGVVSEPVLIPLRFNQPVRAVDIAAHAHAAFRRHPWAVPSIPAEDQARLKAVDPQALDRFNAKVAAVNTVASADGPVGLKVAADWDKKLFPVSPTLVVLETTTPVPPGSWVRLVLDESLPSPGGPLTPGRIQEYTVQAEDAFFVSGFRCRRGCNPEAFNPIELRRAVKIVDLVPAVRATDVTTSGSEKPVAKAKAPKPRPDQERDRTAVPTVEDAGFAAQPPARTYAVVIDQNLKSADGQTLGYTWLGTVENWHRSAFTSFGDGHGVWESSGGAVLPFYARNFENIKQWAQAVRPDQLMPTVLDLEQHRFDQVPAGPGALRALPVTIDKIQSHGLDMSAALPPTKKGLVWAAVEEGKEVPHASRDWADDRTKTPRKRATLVQVTNLGIAVKDSPQNTLVFVTRLDNGLPVAGARVSIIRPDNSTLWTGTTGSDGVVVAPQTALRDRQQGDFWQQMHKVVFIVTAEKDGDVAYACSNWNEGIEPWSFGVRFDLSEGDPLLRGSVFTDRGVYRLGEEIHFKAVLRHNTPTGIKALPAGTDVSVIVRDSLGKTLDERKVKVGRWSSAEWTLKLPEDGHLGDYGVDAFLEQDNVKPKNSREPEGTRASDAYVPWNKKVTTSFLVAAYRRPDFRVDVTLASTEAAPIAGAPLKGVVKSRYLFGAPMGGRPVSWTFSKAPVWNAPEAVYERFNEERWAFVGWPEDERVYQRQLQRQEGTLAKTGEFALDLKTAPEAGIPWRYTLEGDVEDVSRQHIANRADLLVHPAAWYIGVRRPSYFVQQKDGLKTEVVAVAPNGAAASGVNVEVTLTQVQWKSVRRAEGDGFYNWESQRTEVPAGRWTVTTAEQPVPLEIPLATGGYFVLRATAKDKEGRTSATTLSFYSLGEGYTAWARFDHQRITLVPERKTYKPGETARVMIQSPWEKATALVTTEREGIRSHRQFALTSTQQAIEIPLTDEDIPNVFVSVLLVKGRTEQPADPLKAGADTSDPGKPAFRLGYAELKVENRGKRLTVAVKADKDEYRPANAATVTVDVKDVAGTGAASEVTLWAVDYGVLSLTGYQTPDVLDSVYVQKALQVINSDNRERIISRRVLTPKGANEGGGGGGDAGAGTLRKDFKVLAFWLGSVVTDASGHARVEVKLPESLTTYRIMAVAGDLQSRFGTADAEVRINKPVTLKAAFPRFLAVGDKALFGAVVTSQLKTATSATVSFKSLDPSLLELTGPAQQTIVLQPGASAEVRFDLAAKAIGRARLQISVRAGNETDAFEDVLPTEVLASPETVA
ncbi:MAG: MG2 domain-containing protein, partial [Bacteroidales bacterium]